MAPIYNPSVGDAEAGAWRVGGQPELYKRACFKRELKRGGCEENTYKKGKRAKVL